MESICPKIYVDSFENCFVKDAVWVAKKIDITDYIACSLCKGELNLTRKGYVCQRCRLSYPVKDGIPILLSEEARQI